MHALLLRQVMDKLREFERRTVAADVVVVGGGYAGVEIATTVAEKLGGLGRVKVAADPDVCNPSLDASKVKALHAHSARPATAFAKQRARLCNSTRRVLL